MADVDIERYRLDIKNQHGHVIQYVRAALDGGSSELVWEQRRPLGKGGFGEVSQWRWEDKHGDSHYRAVKKCAIDKMRVAKVDYKRELSALAAFSESECAGLFVNFRGWWIDSENLFVAMEYLSRGDLSRYISLDLHETDAKEIIRNVLQGLEFMHKKGFIHRDIKPQNILVVENRPEFARWWVKIADFGLSKRVLDSSGSTNHSIRGTYNYCAPEILDQRSNSTYTEKVDMWSLGCVLFNISSQGQVPFTQLGLWDYCSGRLPFNAQKAKLRLGEDGLSFIESLLQAQPERRLTAAGAFAHRWVAGHDGSASGLVTISQQTLVQPKRQNYNSFLDSSVSTSQFSGIDKSILRARSHDAGLNENTITSGRPLQYVQKDVVSHNQNPMGNQTAASRQDSAEKINDTSVASITTPTSTSQQDNISISQDSQPRVTTLGESLFDLDLTVAAVLGKLQMNTAIDKYCGVSRDQIYKDITKLRDLIQVLNGTFQNRGSQMPYANSAQLQDMLMKCKTDILGIGTILTDVNSGSWLASKRWRYVDRDALPRRLANLEGWGSAMRMVIHRGVSSQQQVQFNTAPSDSLQGAATFPVAGTSLRRKAIGTSQNPPHPGLSVPPGNPRSRSQPPPVSARSTTTSPVNNRKLRLRSASIKRATGIPDGLSTPVKVFAFSIRRKDASQKIGTRSGTYDLHEFWLSPYLAENISRIYQEPGARTMHPFLQRLTKNQSNLDCTSLNTFENPVSQPVRVLRYSVMNLLGITADACSEFFLMHDKQHLIDTQIINDLLIDLKSLPVILLLKPSGEYFEGLDLSDSNFEAQFGREVLDISKIAL